jgi:hypothetical protein
MVESAAVQVVFELVLFGVARPWLGWLRPEIFGVVVAA